jgi:PIN domain nuclease of toxin-antitoxin system
LSEYVLDASAVLALLNAEAGGEAVKPILPKSSMSAVNQAEVVSRLAAVVMPEEEIRVALGLLGIEIVPFDEELAYRSGLLYPKASASGLSLGDRACLALGMRDSAVVVTADRAWGDVQVDAQIELIRGERKQARGKGKGKRTE